MVEQYVEGADAIKLLSNLAINSFANFPVNRAKQFVPCSYDRHVIGDGILFHLGEERFVFVGRAPAASWIQFHAETGGYKVKTEKDDRSPSNPRGRAVLRRNFRFQIQGPNAPQIIEKLNGGPVPEIKFSTWASSISRDARSRPCATGMAGAPGLELWGPYEEREEIRAAIVAAGKDLDSRKSAPGPTPPTRSSRGGFRRPARGLYQASR